MSEIGSDPFDLIVLSKADSTSGKYMFFYGQHTEGGVTCYDVGSFNRTTGEVRRAHYREHKPLAILKWEELLEKGTGGAGGTGPGAEDREEYIEVKG